MHKTHRTAQRTGTQNIKTEKKIARKGSRRDVHWTKGSVSAQDRLNKAKTQTTRTKIIMGGRGGGGGAGHLGPGRTRPGTASFGPLEVLSVPLGHEPFRVLNTLSPHSTVFSARPPHSTQFSNRVQTTKHRHGKFSRRPFLPLSRQPFSSQISKRLGSAAVLLFVGACRV